MASSQAADMRVRPKTPPAVATTCVEESLCEGACVNAWAIEFAGAVPMTIEDVEYCWADIVQSAAISAPFGQPTVPPLTKNR